MQTPMSDKGGYPGMFMGMGKGGYPGMGMKSMEGSQG